MHASPRRDLNNVDEQPVAYRRSRTLVYKQIKRPDVTRIRNVCSRTAREPSFTDRAGELALSKKRLGHPWLKNVPLLVMLFWLRNVILRIQCFQSGKVFLFFRS